MQKHEAGLAHARHLLACSEGHSSPKAESLNSANSKLSVFPINSSYAIISINSYELPNQSYFVAKQSDTNAKDSSSSHLVVLQAEPDQSRYTAQSLVATIFSALIGVKRSYF